jgi:hypothetical protein
MREKPTFQAEGSFWVNPEYLPTALVSDLKIILSSRTKMTVDEKDLFLNCCHFHSQLVNEFLVIKPKADTRDRLTLLAEKADELLDAMKALSKESIQLFKLNFDEFSLVPNSSVELSFKSVESISDVENGRFLGAAWDAVINMQAVASHASSSLKPDRSDKVASENANHLIWNICDAYREITGKLPPYSKGLWFPEFMEKLGGWKGLDLQCGRARIETMIKNMHVHRVHRDPPD